MAQEILIFEKEYNYENSINISEDLETCFSVSENVLAECIPDKYKGVIKIKVTYEERSPCAAPNVISQS